MYYIIVSTVNNKKLDDISHEIININYDRKDSIIKFNSYIKQNVTKKYKLCDNNMKLTYNDNNLIITVQIIEYHDNSKEIFNEFIDDIESDKTEEHDLSNINECINKMNTVIDKSSKETLQITDNYNTIISKYKKLHEIGTKGKSLVLKF